MNISSFKRSLGAAAVGVGLTFGVATQASAVAVFSVNHTPLSGVAGCVAACPPGTGADFESNLITGNSSTLLTRQVDNSVVGSGWINLTGFALNNVAVLPGVHRVGVDYELWASFSYTLAPISGTFGQANSSYAVTSVSVSLYGQSGTTAVFTPADAATNTPATVAAGAAQLLGGGVGLGGVAGLNALGGAFFNSVITYQNTAFGDSFFVFPVPFYNFAFDEFNNTSQGISVNGDVISVNQATGSIDFIGRLPEPGALALAGLALLGAGAARRAVRKTK